MTMEFRLYIKMKAEININLSRELQAEIKKVTEQVLKEKAIFAYIDEHIDNKIKSQMRKRIEEIRKLNNKINKLR